MLIEVVPAFSQLGEYGLKDGFEPVYLIVR
jgi:hypothetical protein